MPRPSSIDQLPEEVRTEIGRLRSLGWTIDQILEHLRTLLDRAPSRSALGRHIQGLDQLGEKMRRSRTVAEALVRELGEDAQEGRSARLNIELMHSAILDLFLRAEDAEGNATPVTDPDSAMLLAKALDHLARARRSDAELTLRLKRELAAEMEKKLRRVEKDAEAAPMTAAEALARVRALYRGEG